IMKITGNVFVVTGAGNGIGRDVALELLSRGARVAGVDVSAAALADTAALAGAGDRCTVHDVDLTDRESVDALPDAVEARHGRVDGLIHVAGVIQRFVPVRELSTGDIDTVFDVNLWGTVNVNKAFLEPLLARPAAALVNVSSMGGLIPFPGQTAYSASKGAVKLWTEGLHAELAQSNVTVTVVFPGAIATDIARNSGAGKTSAAATDSPIKMTSSIDAARQIVEAVAKGKVRVRIGNDAKLLDRLSRVMPTKAIELIAKKMASAAGAATAQEAAPTQ